MRSTVKRYGTIFYRTFATFKKKNEPKSSNSSGVIAKIKQQEKRYPLEVCRRLFLCRDLSVISSFLHKLSAETEQNTQTSMYFCTKSATKTPKKPTNLLLSLSLCKIATNPSSSIQGSSRG